MATIVLTNGDHREVVESAKEIDEMYLSYYQVGDKPWMELTLKILNMSGPEKKVKARFKRSAILYWY